MTIEHPEKFGIGGWSLDNGMEGDPYNPSPAGTILNGIDAIGFDSYQTWHPWGLADTDSTPEHIKQMEAVWNIADDSSQLLQGHAGDLLIGFNEPENSWNAISPQQALDAWPQLMATGMRLSTPSTWDPNGAWITQFMQGAHDRGLRVDVMNVHWYGTDISNFKQVLENYHNKYGLPIVVSEWAYGQGWVSNDQFQQGIQPSVSPEQQAAFAKAGAEMLDDLPYVEKAFWYSATEGGGSHSNSSVINQDGSMTAVGKAWYEVLHNSGVDPVVQPGTGTDTLTLKVSEDFYQTDAQFTVAVDGKQVGGVQTSHAHAALGQSENFTFQGDWSAGSHDVSVKLVNDGWDGDPWWTNGHFAEGHDRNIHVEGATYDGQVVSMSPLFINDGGTPKSFTVTDSGGQAQTSPPADPTPTPTPTPGTDTLTIRASADHLGGTNPNMVVSLDGKVLDNTSYVAAIHQQGQWQDFTFTGNFGAGQHDIGISMSQDGWDGTPWWTNGTSPEGHDLNLYVDSVTLNGRTNPVDAFINMAGITSHWTV